jgi:hypothetical protein
VDNLDTTPKKVVKIKPNRVKAPEDRVTITNKGWGVSDYVAKSAAKSSLTTNKPLVVPTKNKNSSGKVIQINNQKIKKLNKPMTNSMGNTNGWGSDDDDDSEWVELK